MVEELKKIYENLLSKITLDFERDYNIDTDKWAIVLVWERGI